MATRPGADAAGMVPAARRSSAVLALLTVAVTLAAACSGSPRGAEPTVTSANAVSDSLPVDPASTPVDAGDQIEPDDSTAGSIAESDGDGPATEGTADGDTTGGGTGTAGEVEGGTAGLAAAGDGTLEDGTVEDEGDLELLVTGPIAPLTGLITTDSSLAQRRALAVKVDNSGSESRPQAGLAAADIVYEVLVEAARTRFIAVFHSEIPSRIGPVRSARSSDIDILDDLATPYLASSGANNTVLRELGQAARAGTLVDVGGARMYAPYTRDRSRRAPHNLYFLYENLVGGDPDSLPGGLPDAPPAPLFDYGSPNPPGLPDATGVTVTYHKGSGNVVSHIWDSISGGWVRIQRGSVHTTETDFGIAEVAPANVAVVWLPYGTSAADRRSPQALSYGSGEALVLIAGSVHEAVWERTEGQIGFRFSDAAGNPLSLSPGATWLLLANTSGRWPVAEVTVLTASDGARMLAEARLGTSLDGNVVSAS